MANNQYTNKVVFNGATLIDISDTTATASDVLEGKYFYLPNGNKVQGTMQESVNIPTFYGCTDNELASILSDSSINVYNDLGWRVGDIRKVVKNGNVTTWYIAKIESNTIYIFDFLDNLSITAENPSSSNLGPAYSAMGAALNCTGETAARNAQTDLNNNHNHNIAQVNTSLTNFYNAYISGTVIDTFAKTITNSFNIDLSYYNSNSGTNTSYPVDYTISNKVMILNKTQYDNKAFDLLNTYQMIPISDINVGDATAYIYWTPNSKYSGYYCACPIKYSDKSSVNYNFYKKSFTYNGVYMALNKA